MDTRAVETSLEHSIHNEKDNQKENKTEQKKTSERKQCSSTDFSNDVNLPCREDMETTRMDIDNAEKHKRRLDVTPTNETSLNTAHSNAEDIKRVWVKNPI